MLRVRFGVFELSSEARELRKHGILVRLPPQPFQVLTILIERAGEVVNRDAFQERLWGQDDTTVEFDAGLNRCIRQIRVALNDPPAAPRYIETVPRKGYRFVAPVEVVEPQNGLPTPIEEALLPITEPQQRENWFRSKVVAWSLAAVALAAIGIFAFEQARSYRPHLSEDLTVVPLAIALGDQFSPTFSPDGRQVAFTWNGETQDNFDIYLKLVGSSSPALRLTTNKDVDYSPAWSPDGQWIAFCRGTDTRGGAIWIVPALGGTERKVVDLNALGVPSNRSITWSRDSKNLVVSDELAGQSKIGLHLINVKTAEIRQITTPSGSDYDMHPAVSADGQTIAFTRDVGRGISSIMTVPFAGGTPQTISAPRSQHIYNARPTWTPDGNYIAFVSNSGGDGHVWLSAVRGNSPSQEVAALGDGVQDAIVSAAGQFAFVHEAEDSNIWMMDLRGLPASGPPKPKRIFASTRTEESPAVRPDGAHIAFASNRSGFGEIWTGRTDGSDSMQVTYLGNPVTGSPDWSPDGRRLVFDSRAEGRAQLYTMSADGGRAEPLPSGEGSAMVPRWSTNGQWIYFCSDRTGQMQVCRLPVAGGPAEQITREGGFAPIPSRDGESIYYSSTNAPVSALWELRNGTGKRTLITSSVIRRAYAPGPEGVYFFSGSTSDERSVLYFFDNRSQRKTAISSTEKRIGNGIALAPDGHTLYYSQMDVSGHQLMLVPKFWK